MGINFQNVSFKYDLFSSKNTINNIDLKIDSKDEFVCLLGHTGSGKSTLVQLMNALLLPTDGDVEIFNGKVIVKKKKILKFNTKKNRIRYNLKKSKLPMSMGTKIIYNSKLKDIRKHIGLVFQFPEYQLFETTVLKDVMFGPKNFGLSEEEAKKEAIKALKLVGLPDELVESSPFNLSGGQMRRVAIAGILAISPEVIILDEPTVGLDPEGKDELMALLTKIQADTHKTIIMISHDMNVVAKYAKRIIVMKDGNIVYDGKKRALFEDADKLHKFNLEIPYCASLALKLKDKGLIKYTHLPLYKEELIKVIEGGDIYE